MLHYPTMIFFLATYQSNIKDYQAQILNTPAEAHSTTTLAASLLVQLGAGDLCICRLHLLLYSIIGVFIIYKLYINYPYFTTLAWCLDFTPPA